VSTLRHSACPGLLRIVPARDGGICRVKLPGGVLNAAQARAIAGAIDTHASGIVDITNRANLQLRGVKHGHEDALIAALLDAGLGPRETAHAFADDVRNVMISPAAGVDQEALFDTTALAGDLLAALESDTRFASLSPKFALMLDGGERLTMLDHPHDIWFSALRHPARDEVVFAFGLAGCPPVSGVHDHALAAVAPSNVIALAQALLHTFLDLASPEATRMRDLLAVQSVESVLKHAQNKLDVRLLRDTFIDAWRRPPADASRRLGAHVQRDERHCHVGAQPALGRMHSATLRGLAQLLRHNTQATLRMTPWQGILLTNIEPANIADTQQAFESLGLICDAKNPLTRVIACAGSMGCARSRANTKADALSLAATPLPANVEVHLTGCERSCAAAHRAPTTLLATGDGRYDLYQTQDPRDANGFGHCIARGLTTGEAADILNTLNALPSFNESPDA